MAQPTVAVKDLSGEVTAQWSCQHDPKNAREFMLASLSLSGKIPKFEGESSFSINMVVLGYTLVYLIFRLTHLSLTWHWSIGRFFFCALICGSCSYQISMKHAKQFKLADRCRTEKTHFWLGMNRKTRCARSKPIQQNQPRKWQLGDRALASGLMPHKAGHPMPELPWLGMVAVP
jgi:hypothetical protein